MTRRELLAAVPASAFAQTTSSNPPAWFNRPMRWAQVAFTEDDPGNYDLAMWLAYFKKIHADAACLSAGGCVAFYPTKIPLHYRSKFLGNGDAFGDIAFLDGGARSADAVALTETDLLVLSRGRFDLLAEEHPRLGHHFFAALARSLAIRLRQADAEIRVLGES